MVNTMNVRAALDGDYEQVEVIWQELNQHHVALEPELMRRVSPYQPRKSFEGAVASTDQDILIAEENSVAAGAIWLEKRVHEGGAAVPMSVVFIQELGVLARFRRAGVGRLLMAHAELWASERSVRRIEFNVWESNATAIAFYEELGYRPVRQELSKPVS